MNSIGIARDFLHKLISPAIEETGLLLKDQAAGWRINNQVSILNLAKAKCEKNNVPLKIISLKLLCPLLDYSGLEEDEFLQDKWANMLTNLADSRQSIENHVFPYILSQISKNEYLTLEKCVNSKRTRAAKYSAELEQFTNDHGARLRGLQTTVKLNDHEIRKLLSASGTGQEMRALRNAKNAAEEELVSLEQSLQIIKKGIYAEEELFESSKIVQANLMRLGLIKETHFKHATSQTPEIPDNSDREYLNINPDDDVSTERAAILTMLGELFIETCEVKITNE